MLRVGNNGMQFDVRALVAGFALLSICIPQWIIAVPGLGERIKTPDLFAVLTVAVVMLLCLARCTSMRKEQLAVCLVIGYAACVVFTRILFDSERWLYRENLPYLARLFSIHAPLLLIAVMPRDRQSLSRWLLGFGLLATMTSLVIAVLFHFGSTAFDAHQTFARQGGELTHRLGGLQGETGAYAFNATMGIQLLLVGLAMREMRKRFYLMLWIAFPLYVALIFHESLVRIALLNSLVFFFVAVVGVNHSRKSLRFVVLLLLLMCIGGSFMLSAAGNPLVDVNVDRVSFDGSLDQLSSGRWSHWVAASDAWLDDPTYVLFGMGHRASDFVLNHPVENLVVFHLANYGIVGSLLFAGLYGMLAWPVLRQGIRGDFACGVFSAILISVFMQWQVNDVNLYYQTFPCVLFFTAWYSSVLQQQTVSGASAVPSAAVAAQLPSSHRMPAAGI